MADEIADVSNKKQLVVCLRCVDNDVAAHEEFIGIHQVASIQSDVLILFGVHLGQHVLQHTDNVSKTLECPSLSATSAYSCASLTVSTLQGLQNDEAFRLFWENVLATPAPIWSCGTRTGKVA